MLSFLPLRPSFSASSCDSRSPCVLTARLIMQLIIRHNQKPFFKISVVLVLLLIMLGVLHVLEEVFEIWTKQAIVDMQDSDIISIDAEHR